MGPRRQRFWFPLIRLGAFFGAVVVAGNVLLQGAFSPADADSDPEGRADFIGRSKRRLEKRLKAIERLFFGSGHESGEDSGAICMADPELEAAQDSGLIADANLMAGGMPASIAVPEPPALLLVAWPVIPEPPALRPPVERVSLELSLTPELVEQFYRSGAADPIGDFGDGLLRGPEALLDGALWCVTSLLPRSDTYSVRGQTSAGVTGRIFEFQAGGREGRIFPAFASNWLDREQRYFSRFADSGLDTVGVENGTEEVNARWLIRDQGKLLWDAARRTYLSRYRFEGEERIQTDAFSIGQWSAADVVVLPPLVAGYLWFRGLEKKASLGDTWLRFSVEPLSRWVSGKADLVAGVSVEWGIKGVPVGLILSAGKYDGRAGLDFVGIGTSVGMVRQMLETQLGDSSARSSGRAW